VAVRPTAAALGWAGPLVFALAPWQPFFAQARGETPLLLVRAGLLLALALVGEAYSARRRAAWLGASALLLVASLSFRILFLPYCGFVLVAIGVATRHVRRTPSKREQRLGWAALALAAATALVPRAERAVLVEPADPTKAVSFWMEHRNLYQARYWALKWAKRETVPGEGYLALARVDIEMARPDRARKALIRTAARTQSDDIRQRAQALIDTLDRAVSIPRVP
jgi:hypothetical protein